MVRDMGKKKPQVTPGDYGDVVKVLFNQRSKEYKAAVILHFANGMMFGFYPRQAAELAKSIAGAAKKAAAK